MTNDDGATDKRQFGPKDLWKLVLAAIGLIAVVQELRTPPEDREWHGAVGPFPYDLRMPTLERARQTYWDPTGPLVSTKLWGVGWAPNLGAITRLIEERIRGGSGAPVDDA